MGNINNTGNRDNYVRCGFMSVIRFRSQFVNYVVRPSINTYLRFNRHTIITLGIGGTHGDIIFYARGAS